MELKGIPGLSNKNNIQTYILYQLWFIMPQKIINPTMVNADIVIKEQAE